MGGTPTGRDEQTALQVGASSWHQPGRALGSVSCRATGKTKKSLRNSTTQFTHGPPSIISKHFQTRELKMGGNYKRGATLFGASTSVIIPWVPEVPPTEDRVRVRVSLSRPNTPTQIPVEYPPCQQFWLGKRETEARLTPSPPRSGLATSCSRSQPEFLAAESEEPLAPRVQQLTRGRKKKHQKPKPVWCDVSHLSVKTLLSDKGPTHHPKLHTSLGRPNTSTILQQLHSEIYSRATSFLVNIAVHKIGSRSRDSRKIKFGTESHVKNASPYPGQE